MHTLQASQSYQSRSGDGLAALLLLLGRGTAGWGSVLTGDLTEPCPQSPSQMRG